MIGFTAHNGSRMTTVFPGQVRKPSSTMLISGESWPPVQGGAAWRRKNVAPAEVVPDRQVDEGRNVVKA